MIHRKDAARPEILSGWKDIAKFLGRGVRTVQRYEREMGLPIHRPVGHPFGGVFAAKAELDAWVAAGPTRLDLQTKRLHGRTNKVGADFLQIDSEIALTFSAGIADERPRKKKTHDSGRSQSI
jgi:hypothetical protein